MLLSVGTFGQGLAEDVECTGHSETSGTFIVAENVDNARCRRLGRADSYGKTPGSNTIAGALAGRRAHGKVDVGRTRMGFEQCKRMLLELLDSDGDVSGVATTTPPANH